MEAAHTAALAATAQAAQEQQAAAVQAATDQLTLAEQAWAAARHQLEKQALDELVKVRDERVGLSLDP